MARDDEHSFVNTPSVVGYTLALLQCTQVWPLGICGLSTSAGLNYNSLSNQRPLRHRVHVHCQDQPSMLTIRCSNKLRLLLGRQSRPLGA
jgi:hypothetical protein